MPSLFIEDAPESKRQRLNDLFIKHEEEDGTDDVSIGTSPPLFDAASARLIELTSEQIQLMKYPVGCSVWYDIQPGTQDMKVKVGVVESISVDVTTRNVLYEIIPSVNSKGTNDKMFYLEEQLCYASKCLVHVVQHDKCMKGEVITCNTCWADQSLKKTYMVSLFLEENQISILPSVDGDNIKFCLAAGCSTDQSGLPVGGNNESGMNGELDDPNKAVGPAMAKGNSYLEEFACKNVANLIRKSTALENESKKRQLVRKSKTLENKSKKKRKKQPTTVAGRNEQAKLHHIAVESFEQACINAGKKLVPGDNRLRNHPINVEFKQFIEENIELGVDQFYAKCEEKGYRLLGYNKEEDVWAFVGERTMERQLKKRFVYAQKKLKEENEKKAAAEKAVDGSTHHVVEKEK